MYSLVNVVNVWCGVCIVWRECEMCVQIIKQAF